MSSRATGIARATSSQRMTPRGRPVGKPTSTTTRTAWCTNDASSTNDPTSHDAPTAATMPRATACPGATAPAIMKLRPTATSSVIRHGLMPGTRLSARAASAASATAVAERIAKVDAAPARPTVPRAHPNVVTLEPSLYRSRASVKPHPDRRHRSRHPYGEAMRRREKADRIGEVLDDLYPSPRSRSTTPIRTRCWCRWRCRRRRPTRRSTR